MHLKPCEAIGDVTKFIESLDRDMRKRAAFMNTVERYTVNEELQIMRSSEVEVTSIPELVENTAVISHVIYSDEEECLERMHMVAGIGTMNSCKSSLPIVLSLLSYMDDHRQLIVGRGHVAPVFYACDYLAGRLPLVLILALHSTLPAVVHQAWGFSNTVRHSLGEGLPTAVGRAITCADHVICFSGDGELNEGASFEAIRFSYEQDISNLTLVIDNNKTGITPLPKALNIGFLRAYFDQVIELNGEDNLETALASAEGKRTAIVCHTVKGAHGFSRPGTTTLPTTCSTMGDMLNRIKTSSSHDFRVITADLSCRFGIEGNIDFLNVGLAENLSVGLTLGMPASDIKVVLTDDKYLHNAGDILASAFASVKNLHVIAARKNKTWGGQTTSSDVFDNLLPGQVLEVSDPDHLEKIMVRYMNLEKNGFYLINDQNLEAVMRLRDEYSYLEDRKLLIRRSFGRLTVVTSESTTLAAAKVLEDFPAVTHIRALDRRPNLAGLIQGPVIVMDHAYQSQLADHVKRVTKVTTITSNEIYDSPSDHDVQDDFERRLRKLIKKEYADV